MTDAGHRVLWTVIGLLLTAVGGAGVAAGLGRLPGTDPGAPLLWSGLLDLWRDVTPWGLVLVAVVGLVLAWLGWHLLYRQLWPRRQPALGWLDLHAAGSPDTASRSYRGSTRVRGSTLAHGLARDLVRVPGVRAAAVTLTGDPVRPALRIRLRLRQVQLTAVRGHVDAAVSHFTATGGLRPGRLDVTVRVDRDRVVSGRTTPRLARPA